MRNIFKRVGNFIKTVKEHRNQPVHVEFVLSDFCNLNCKGCGHYSSLAQKEYEPIDRLRKNAGHLGRTVGTDLESVYLIGGEPLIYPYLIEAIEVVRESFPETPVKLFTNGLMLPRMGEDFWRAVKDNEIEIALTRYPIAFDYDAAVALCRSRGVRHSVFGDRTQENSFFRFALDPMKKQNGRISHFKCFNRGCLSVIGDRLYPCSISGCIGHLNRAAGTEFRHLPGDWLDVADIKSIRQIKQLRDRPVPFCGYCKSNPQSVEYGPSRREASEWVDLP